MKISRSNAILFSLRVLFGAGDYNRIRDNLLRLAKGLLNPIELVFLCQIEFLIQTGRANEVRLIKENIFSSRKVINLQLVRAYYLLGQYSECLIQISNLGKTNREILYIKASCYMNIGKKEEAIKIYLNKNLCKFKKTWLYLANTVENKEEFEHFKIKFIEYKREEYDYFILAAKRGKVYDEAINLLRSIINKEIYAEFVTLNKKRSINSKHAKRAYVDLIKTLSKREISTFVVSGTLLGFIRDKNFIKGDNDIDIGVVGLDNYEKIIKVVQESGLFVILPARTKKTIRVRHVNGVPIDIFLHWYKDGKLWHGGVKVDWWNTPFEITEIVVAGIKLSIPKNYELYLVENYGNWREPAINFDSAIDTPNAITINEDEFKIHILENIIKFKKKPIVANRYIEMARSFFEEMK